MSYVVLLNIDFGLALEKLDGWCFLCGQLAVVAFQLKINVLNCSKQIKIIVETSVAMIDYNPQYVTAELSSHLCMTLQVKLGYEITKDTTAVSK